MSTRARGHEPLRSVLALGLAALAGCAAAHATDGAAGPTAGTAGRTVVGTAGPAPARGDDFDRDLLARAGVDAAALRCNRDVRWDTTLKADSEQAADDLMAAVVSDGAPKDATALRAKLARLVFWRMVRAVLIHGDTNNLGVVPLAGRTWTDEAGRTRPVILFRSGVTPSPAAFGSCFRSLLDAGHVKHVVNLFDGEIPVADLVAEESAAAKGEGATYHTASDEPAGYGPWRSLLRKSPDDPDARRRASDGVARLIRDQILLPDGAPPRGNIHVHCGGGMHRTGMIVGILERCIDRLPDDVVEAHYHAHVGWRDAQHPGGSEDGNLRFIREFDCALLGLPGQRQ